MLVTGQTFTGKLLALKIKKCTLLELLQKNPKSLKYHVKRGGNVRKDLTWIKDLLRP